jgi:hypothetical protein
VLELEDTLGITIDAEFSLPTFLGWRLFWWHGKAPSTVGEWIKQVAHILQRSTTSGRTTP